MTTAFLGQQQQAPFRRWMEPFSERDLEIIERILPGSAEILRNLCDLIHWYRKSVELRDVKGIVRDYDLINKELDKLGDKEGDLWIYLIAYCNVEGPFLDAFHALRKTLHPENFPLPSPRLPVATPSAARRPTPTFSIPPFPPTPSPLPTPSGGFMPAPMAQLPRTVVPGPPLPRYTDVMTPSVPTYGRELQEQIESYEGALKDWYGRPAVTTLGPTASMAPGSFGPFRPSSGGPEVTAPQMPIQAPQRPGGAGTPFPGTSVPTRPSCPPGQFWDGRQCRGSIAPGAAGLISAAAGGGGAIGPGAFTLPGAGPTFAVSGRPRYRPGQYRPQGAALGGSRVLGQTFDELLGLSPEVGDILRLVYHGGGAWLGLHVAMSNGKTPWFSAIGWMIMGGMGIAGVLDVVSLLKRACGTHPPAVTTAPGLP